MFAACSGSDAAPPTTHALDPFATAAASSPSSEHPPALTPAALSVGQCFDTGRFVPGAAIDLSDAQIVDCASPHQHEVYAVAVEPSGRGAPYPGDEPLAAFADDQCLAAFAPYTGTDYQASHYDIANARPDAAAWNHGERNVVCALHDVDFAPLVGSARAAGAAPAS